MSDNPKEVAYDALREMYEEAEPPLDFDDALENPDDYGEGWYNEHELPKERQKEIVDSQIEEADLTEHEKTAVIWTAILDFGPANK